MTEREEDEHILERDPQQRSVHDLCAIYLSKCRSSTRYGIAALSSLGFLVSFAMRCNMEVALYTSTLNTTSILNKEIRFLPDYYWTPETINMIDTSFFWGYLITQIPGGYLATQFPANKIFGIAIAVSSCLNMLIPLACELHYVAVMSVRILQGLAEGVMYPACHGIWRHWAPPLERSKLATISFAGASAGMALGLPVSRYIAKHYDWKPCFYNYGTFGVIWFIAWWFYSSESPATHRWITSEERLFIECAIDDKTVRSTNELAKRIPWKNIATSWPVYAIIVANVGWSWTYYLMVRMQHVLFYNRHEVCFHVYRSYSSLLCFFMFSCFPHLAMMIVVLFGGFFADYLRRKQMLDTTKVRKLFHCGGFTLQACCLLIAGFTHNPTYCSIILLVATSVSGFAIAGFPVNHLDIAPRYASILMGFSHGLGTLAAMICQLVVERLSNATEKLQKYEEQIPGDFHSIFIAATVIHVVAVGFYGIFASGEKQPWADPPNVDKGNSASAFSGTEVATKDEHSESETPGNDQLTEKMVC